MYISNSVDNYLQTHIKHSLFFCLHFFLRRSQKRLYFIKKKKKLQMVWEPLSWSSALNHTDNTVSPIFPPPSMLYGLWLLHYAKCLQMNLPLLYARFWLAGSVPEHCQSQSVNKTLIGCWPVRIGLVWKKKKAITGPAVSRRPRVRWWKWIKKKGGGGSFKAPQRRTPIGPGAIWVKRESKGRLRSEREEGRGGNVLDI